MKVFFIMLTAMSLLINAQQGLVSLERIRDAAMHARGKSNTKLFAKKSGSKDVFELQEDAKFLNASCGKGATIEISPRGYAFKSNNKPCKYLDYEFFGHISFDRDGKPDSITFNPSQQTPTNYAFKIPVSDQLTFYIEVPDQTLKEITKLGFRANNYLVTSIQPHTAQIFLLGPEKIKGLPEMPAYSKVTYNNDTSLDFERGISNIEAPFGKVIRDRGMIAHEISYEAGNFLEVILAEDLTIDGMKFLKNESITFDPSQSGSTKKLKILSVESNRDLEKLNGQQRFGSYKFENGKFTFMKPSDQGN